MILQAKQISKTYPGVQVFENISLSLSEGESVAISGPSGVGKTTLLNVLSTLDKPDTGYVDICGQTDSVTIRRDFIGFIFQSFNLLEEYTVLENVLMPGKIARRNLPRAYGEALLQKVRMTHRSDSLAKTLSGGEKQRVAIARSLCNDPKILFADEPSGNLDHENSLLIHDLLLDCSVGRGLIVVTHDVELAKRCDRVVTMEELSCKSQ